MASRELVVIPPGGGEFPLTNRMAGYRVLKGASGLGRPAVEFGVDTTPLLDGVTVEDVYAPPRTIQLPMLILAGGDRDLYRQRIKALQAVLPREEFALEVRQPDGQRRRIPAWYAGGLDGAEDKDTGGETWAKFVLKLYCPTPWWFDPVPVRYRWEVASGASAIFLGNPFLPLRIAQGSVLGDTTITNPGDVKAWPVWTITPPNDTVELIDADAEATLDVVASVPVGQSLTIVTHPGITDVRLSDGTDWWPNLGSAPTFWPVRKGTTNIEVTLTGAGPGSSIEVEFYPRYEAAW